MRRSNARLQQTFAKVERETFADANRRTQVGRLGKEWIRAQLFNVFNYSIHIVSLASQNKQ